MTKRPFQKSAETFAVWRAGNSVNWDCSASDIADVTGLTERRVREICNARKYPLATEAQDASEVDLLDLMSP
jgi:hypothetical protein